MKTRTGIGRLVITTGGLQATALACFGAVYSPAHADAPMTHGFSPAEAALSILAEPAPGEMPLRTAGDTGNGLNAGLAADNGALATGNDMTVLAGLELERSDRQFRYRIVNWAKDRSVAAGVVTDFLLHGSDRGVHLRLHSGSEYVVRWEMRF